MSCNNCATSECGQLLKSLQNALDQATDIGTVNGLLTAITIVKGEKVSKPDWAERLQRTFRRKYEQGKLDERARILAEVGERYKELAELFKDLPDYLAMGELAHWIDPANHYSALPVWNTYRDATGQSRSVARRVEIENGEPLDQSQTLFDLGVIRERERIIKLLQDHNFYGWCGVDVCPIPFPSKHFERLIKGENK